ncbi:hypothetical protein [Rhodovibrio sodomensis]|nr:hypothetical protein [Rhodovibrio sodomensis]
MAKYVWKDRTDPGGRRKARGQFMALALDDRETALFTMTTICEPGPDKCSQCRDPGGLSSAIHAQRVDGASRPVEVLYAADHQRQEVTFLGISTDGAGCRHALSEAATAGVP